MNKLSALSKLSNAYHYLLSTPIDVGDAIAVTELADKFGYIRRSLRIGDLKPQSKDAGRADFEKYIYLAYGAKHKQPWGILERVGEGYLDLYIQLRWEGWQACLTHKLS